MGLSSPSASTGHWLNGFLDFGFCGMEIGGSFGRGSLDRDRFLGFLEDNAIEFCRDEAGGSEEGGKAG
jgi:hypothetical protein